VSRTASQSSDEGLLPVTANPDDIPTALAPPASRQWLLRRIALARPSLVHAERTTAIGILMFVTSSIVLQGLVVLEGSGGRAGSAQAASAAGIAANAINATRSSQQRSTGTNTFAPSIAEPRTAARGDLLALHPQSWINSPTARPDDTAPADTVAAKNAPAASELDLRLGTFGPDRSRSAKLRSESSRAAAGEESGAEATPKISKASFVVAPAIRSLDTQSRQPKADRAIVIDRGESVPVPRVLGRAAKGTGGLVEKVHFQPDTPNRCLPSDLIGVLNDVAQRFGEVQVLSTFRDPERNRRVGGAPQSFHLSCQAIDFRVIGHRAAGVLAYLEGRPEVGGLKRYPLGFFHIDNGPRRTW